MWKLSRIKDGNPQNMFKYHVDLKTIENIILLTSNLFFRTLDPGNTEPQAILRTLDPGNTVPRSILRTVDPGNTVPQPILRTLDPGSTGSQPILRTSHPGRHSIKPVNWTAILAATQSFWVSELIL